MLKMDVGPGFRQLEPNEYVAWQTGDEYLDRSTGIANTWAPTTFATDDLRQAGIVVPFRRPVKLGSRRWARITLRKMREYFFGKAV